MNGKRVSRVLLVVFLWGAVAHSSTSAGASQSGGEIRYGYALMDKGGAQYGERLPCPSSGGEGAGSALSDEPPPVNAVGMSFFLDPELVGRVRVARSDGSVNTGGSPVAGVDLAAPVVGVATMPVGLGYWLAGADGGVFTADGAGFFGSMGNRRLKVGVVGIAATPTGSGYWLVAADGGVFAFGDAPFLGSLAGVRLASPIVGIAATPTGQGYWLAGADGGVFAFGDAPFLGSLAGVRLNKPVVGIAATRPGDGYWLAAADGGVFAYGAAVMNMSLATQTWRLPTVAIALWPQRCPD